MPKPRTPWENTKQKTSDVIVKTVLAVMLYRLAVKRVYRKIRR
jgi:hypothetical protein